MNWTPEEALEEMQAHEENDLNYFARNPYRL